jgi:hypothetical protein
MGYKGFNLHARCIFAVHEARTAAGKPRADGDFIMD